MHLANTRLVLFVIISEQTVLPHGLTSLKDIDSDIILLILILYCEVAHTDALPVELGHSQLRRFCKSRVQSRGVSVKDVSTQFVGQIVRCGVRNADMYRGGGSSSTAASSNTASDAQVASDRIRVRLQCIGARS